MVLSTELKPNNCVQHIYDPQALPVTLVLKGQPCGQDKGGPCGLGACTIPPPAQKIKSVKERRKPKGKHFVHK